MDIAYCVLRNAGGVWDVHRAASFHASSRFANSNITYIDRASIHQFSNANSAITNYRGAPLWDQ